MLSYPFFKNLIKSSWCKNTVSIFAFFMCYAIMKLCICCNVLYNNRLFILSHFLITDHPSLVPFLLPDSQTMSKREKGEWLLKVCETFVDKYFFDDTIIDDLVKKTHQLHLSSLGHYKCRIPPCQKVYLYHSARVR